MKKGLAHYRNGNYDVFLFEDGTKIRYTEEDEFKPAFAENIDVKVTDRCTGTNCQFCLNPSAKIKLEDGTKEIATIRVGDNVWSMNLDTGKLQLKPVLRVYEREYVGNLLLIETECGNVIQCTPNHKIYTKNRGYVRADELTKKDVLFIDQ